MSKKTLVIGASENADRYSNKAVRMLNEYGHEIIALGAKDGQIGNIHITAEQPSDKDIDTVTMYLSPHRQDEVEAYVIGLQPKRIIFNPGAENPLFEEKAKKKGIEVVEACTLVMLRTNQY
ncbi:MAG: CoA-binding protein [Chitinophagales bacterium]|nr:CoA-binding protein [Chitinophagales bacterium]